MYAGHKHDLIKRGLRTLVGKIPRYRNDRNSSFSLPPPPPLLLLLLLDLNKILFKTK